MTEFVRQHRSSFQEMVVEEYKFNWVKTEGDSLGQG